MNEEPFDRRKDIESFSDMEQRAEAIVKDGVENDPDIADLGREACSFPATTTAGSWPC